MHSHNYTDPATGLSSAEAAYRLKSEGYNELPSPGIHSTFFIILSVIKEPMFGLILAAAGVYLLLGDLRESVFLCLFALISILITIIQEWRSERMLDALRDLTSPRALVIRDGKPQRIAGKEVVRGDLVILTEGDRVPADGDVISPDTISLDESLLTGESVAVVKSLATDDKKVFAGSLVVQGSARTVITATGTNSEIGKIGQALKSVEMEQPRLQEQTRTIVRIFAAIGLSLSFFSIILYGFLKHDWLDGILNGIALGMSMLPEEFPLVLTVFMVMGAWRISKANVLTRKASAIETLGSATVLCTDKTGTLTENRMSIAFLRSGQDTWQKGELSAAPDIKDLLRAGIKASKADSYDPMDLAFFKHPLAPPLSPDTPGFHYGLQPHLPMMAQIYKENGSFKVFAKGAPETIAKACKLSAEQTADLHAQAKLLAAQGMRLLAIAEAETGSAAFPEHADGFDYRFLGLAGFADPLRNNVAASIAECRTAGIRVVMITGDYPETAKAIAFQAGIDSENVASGDELKSMDDEKFRQCVMNVNIFARIKPDQKLRIVNALKQNGEIVAMTGDGVNDAPSLKAAHIGVAMGGRGTDVAREASSMVLLDDNFGSLVNAIALGRRIYDNLRKAMVYIIAVHVPIAGLALLPLLFNKPLILTPLLIALMEMVIDPACSVVLEAEEAEKNVMKRPPRNPAASLLSLPALAWGFTQGIVSLLFLGAIWIAAFTNNMPENEIRSLVFVSLMVINMMLILANRSFSSSLFLAFEKKNPFLGWGSLGITALFGVLLLWPPAKDLFGFGPLHGHDVFFAVVAGFSVLITLEFLKPLFQKFMT